MMPRMRHAAALLAVVLLSALAPATAIADILHGQGLLWKIEHEDTAPSHVFGTMHADDDRILDLPRPVETAFADAERYLFELDFASEDMIAGAMRMFYTDGTRLRDQLAPETWQRAVAAADMLDLPEMAVDAFKPWALATLLTVPRSDPDRLLDKRLHDRARALERPVDGLETGDEQLAIFDDLPLRQQVQFLERALEYVEHDRVEDQYERLVELYLQGDLAGMVRLAEDHPLLPGEDDHASLMRRLVDDRNRIMVTRMQRDLERGGAFIAIGALHLPGENGVLELLRQRGYRITPIH